APVPHRRRVLHDAGLRRGRRPAPDPLAERGPQRRADDPPGRVHPALARRPPPPPCFEKVIPGAASLGILLMRSGFSVKLATTQLPPQRVTEESLLDALAGVTHD